MQRPPGQIIRTSRGVMEYILHDAGRGAAVILSHGTGGGYGQGLMLARLLDGFQGIAVSRAGYLSTPIETGHSLAVLFKYHSSRPFPKGGGWVSAMIRTYDESKSA